jgi:hypothetical protein
MTIYIPDWIPMFLLYVGTCVNICAALSLRWKASDAQNELRARLEAWNKAVTEAQVLWDYGAHSEALEVLKDAGVTSEKPRARRCSGVL